MGTKGEQTREHILAIAETLILKNGYSATSIDQILKESGITKGGFFYHFDGKNDLARHLILRYLEQDEIFFQSLKDRASALTEDPLQQLLLFLKLMAEAMEDLPGTHPGCLVASFTYESNQLDDDVRKMTADGILSWRVFFSEQMEKVLQHYPMSIEQPVDQLADMLSSVIEGGIVMSRALDDKSILPNQLLRFRDYIRLLFAESQAA
ncbi:MAG: helix-turn-helix domain-containing protein [Pseudomonadota bacterium]